MTLGFCAVCLAAEANPDHLPSLVRWQNAQLHRLAQADTFALQAAQLRIAELEEIARRLNDRLTRRSA